VRSLRHWAAALAGVAGLVAASAPLPAGGATNGSGSGRESLTLVSQTTWAADGSPFSMRVAIRGSERPSDLDLRVTVYARLRSRSAFAASQRGRSLGEALWSESSTVDQLAGSGGSYSLCVPVDAAPPAGCTASQPVYLNDTAGVYPVQVTLRRQGSTSYLDQMVTHLVLAPTSPTAVRLGLALVVPVAAAQPLGTDGARRLDAATVERLSTIAGLLGEHDGVAMTMVPDPATLAALADTTGAAARAVLAELRKGAGGLQVVGRPFSPVAPYDLVASGLAGELSAQLQRGGDIERTELGVHTNPGTWLTAGPIDGPTLEALSAVGTDRLVISADELQSTGTNLTPSQPYTLTAGGERMPAVGSDASLGADLAGSAQPAGNADPVLAGHELLADAAQTYFEAPNVERGVVALAPRLWQPSRQTTSVILDGLETSPILSSMSVDSLFSDVPASSRFRQAAYPARGSVLPASDIRRDRADQAALAGSTTAPLPAAVSMNDLVLASEGADITRARRNAYLARAKAVLNGQLGLVKVVNSSVTLTARQATVPISVQSQLPVPIAVRVVVSSENNLEFANHETTLVLDSQTLRQQNTTFPVPVSARNTGSFALHVTIVTANGGLTLTTNSLTIRSRVFSGVGVGLSIGALVFLALWWGRELRKGRRGRRAPPARPEEVRRPEPAGVSG
jgi:hypothetical protein